MLIISMSSYKINPISKFFQQVSQLFNIFLIEVFQKCEYRQNKLQEYPLSKARH